jgi:hypothetical protein
MPLPFRLMLFLCPDMIEEEDKLRHFADSSKLLHAKLSLDWRRDDLYGLAALHLANSQPLLEALKGATVPLSLQELTAQWTPPRIEAALDAAHQGQRLPPRRYTSDPNRRRTPEALVEDLIELAVLYRTADGRCNMPDIFRVGFGLKRKGGVRPPR